MASEFIIDYDAAEITFIRTGIGEMNIRLTRQLRRFRCFFAMLPLMPLMLRDVTCVIRYFDIQNAATLR